MEPVLNTVWFVDCVSVEESRNGDVEMSVAAKDMITCKAIRLITCLLP